MPGPTQTHRDLRRKRAWLKVPLPVGEDFTRLKGLARRLDLHTDCEEAPCPNVGECWSGKHSTMTLMVLGDECCEGPTLIEAKTFRMGGHSTADDPRLYIPQEVFDEWKKKDPIPRFEKFLEASGLWTPKIGAAVLQEVTDEVAVAAREAQQVGPPALETIFSDVYAELPEHIRKQGQAAFDPSQGRRPVRRRRVPPLIEDRWRT